MPAAETRITRIFHARDWEQLTPAFGQLKSVVAPHGPKLIANNYTATYFDRCVHEGLLELALVAPDLTYRLFDAAERQKLTIRVPLNHEEGCSIEPYHEGRWYVRRSDLEKLTAIPVTPAKAAARPRERPRKRPGSTFALSLVAAVKNRLEAGHWPGTGGDEQWDRFCDEVRRACEKKATDRGYGDKTIKRIVHGLNEQDEQDEQDK